MKKPRYMEGMLSFVFFWLGLGFAVMGVLGFAGILKPKSSSMVQEATLLGAIFFSVGVAFLVAQTVLGVIVYRRNKLHGELLATGTRMQGTVKKVYLQTYASYGNQSPYRVVYAYNWQGEDCQRKSCLLWDKPDCKEGDAITVYVNADGKATVQI